jgi:hypothetical protein
METMKKWFTLLVMLLAMAKVQTAFADPYEKLHAYKANLHSHTVFSDGASGTPKSALADAKDNQLDIMGITDHAELLTPHAPNVALPKFDLSVCDGPVVCTGQKSADEWGEIGTTVSNFNRDHLKKFLGLRGFEWTADGHQSEEGVGCNNHPLPVILPTEKANIGHINIFGTDNYVSHHFVRNDDASYAQFQVTTMSGLFDWVAQQGYPHGTWH